MIFIFFLFSLGAPYFESQCNSTRNIRLDEGNGHLSSLLAAETGYGSAQCPVNIEASEGQKINVTLIDFSPKLIFQVSNTKNIWFSEMDRIGN